MENERSLVAFEEHKIRRFFDEQNETWYFSVIDVMAALTESVNPRDYWFKMKIRVKTEDGLQLSTNCRQLKMKAPAQNNFNIKDWFSICESLRNPRKKKEETDFL